MAARPEWTTACPDWQRRIVAGESLVPCAPLFPEEAEQGLAVFKSLVIADIPGKPTIGDVGRGWSFDFVASIFGGYDAESERQLIREFLLLVSKKNAKSTLAAGIMMTMLIRNPRHSAEFLILAPTKEIADNSFDPAADMADAVNDGLSGQGSAPLFRVYRREKRIVHLGTRAELKVIAADTDTVGGTKATVVLVDELWLFGKRSGAMSMFREATGGLAARPEGFVIYLSTMSDEPPAGEFKVKLDYARDVRDGKIPDPSFLPLIYEYPAAMIEAEAYLDPANFFVTNPNLGASVDVEYLLREYAKADRTGKDAVTDFTAKHLNVEVGLRSRSNAWPGVPYWERRGEAGLSLDAVLARSEVVVIGIDGGGLDDLFGLAVLGREPREIEVTVMVAGEPVQKRIKRWLLWSHAWCHSGVLERRKSIATTLRDFEKAGELTIVDDDLGDISAIVDVVRQVKDAGLLGGVAVDPAGLGEFVDEMAGIDVTEENGLLVGIGQGYRMMNAIKTAERRLSNGTLLHGGSSLMAWCVGNLKIEPTATAIRATKQSAGDAKIDPAMAMFDAVDLMSTNPEAQGGSIYADPAVVEALYGRPVADDQPWDPAVIADRNHPEFAEHRARFEAWQAAQPDDDFH